MNVAWFVVALLCVLLLIVLTWFPTLGTPRRRDSAAPVFRDDPRYWYGFIYYNPDDPASLVPRRSGWGWTVNFGHPLGKLFLIVLLAMVALGTLVPLLTHAPGCHPSHC